MVEHLFLPLTFKMTQNNSYDREDNLYNSFLDDHIILSGDESDQITIGEINNFEGFSFELDSSYKKKSETIPEEIDPSKNTYPHNYMKTTYDAQRRDRLTDCIDDYLNDDDKTAIDLYDDILATLEQNRDYHDRQKTKIESVIRMMKPDQIFITE